DRDVQFFVVVEIAHGKRGGIPAGGELRAKLKFPRTVSEVNGNLTGEQSRDCQIGFAITVKVCDGDRYWAQPRRNWTIGRRGKCSVAVTQQNNDVVVFCVRNRDVQISILIEIPDGNASGPISNVNRRILRLTERAIPVPQQNRNILVEEIGDDDVKLSVSVKIPNGDCSRQIS